MEQYVIKGGNPLVGDVVIGGAKHAALGILAAAIMADEFVTGCLKQKVGTNWESATVAVRAVKDNGSVYSLWSEKAAISCNAIH